MTIFFVVPAGVIEKKSILNTFRVSLNLSYRHREEVISLTLFIISLAFIAFFLGGAVNLQGVEAGITFGAAILFILLRLFQSIIYTYISVVNPYFYLHRKKK